MEKLRKTTYVILSILAVLIALGSLLSVFRNTDSRFLKMLDFPRIQFFVSALVALIFFIALNKKWQWYDYALALGLAGGMAINGFYLYHYTPLCPVAVPTAETIRPSDDQLSILLSNVKMSNRESTPLINMIEDKQPDMVLAMEIDDWWENQLEVIEKDYPYTHETTNEVAYGMVLYSKIPLKEVDVNYLQNKKVPSFATTIALDSGKEVSFHAVHPVPPTRFKDFPDNAGQEEMAMEKLGNQIEDRTLPTIVAGDLNDVVWSYTNELTETKDLLYDVRVGRGFYNSYNAHNFLMRWPLDHVFVTDEFKLNTLERLPEIGSDHFPIYVELVL